MEKDSVNEENDIKEMRTLQKKRSPLIGLMALAALAGIGELMPEPKQKRKCLLKTCNVLTEHNGGYCCAEHFKMNKGN